MRSATLFAFILAAVSAAPALAYPAYPDARDLTTAGLYGRDDLDTLFARGPQGQAGEGKHAEKHEEKEERKHTVGEKDEQHHHRHQRRYSTRPLYERDVLEELFARVLQDATGDAQPAQAPAAVASEPKQGEHGHSGHRKDGGDHQHGPKDKHEGKGKSKHSDGHAVKQGGRGEHGGKKVRALYARDVLDALFARAFKDKNGEVKHAVSATGGIGNQGRQAAGQGLGRCTTLGLTTPSTSSSEVTQ
ncbi:uncharacterized protein B0H18DRAFT_570989 [Fomitopsis serialis]|uniref:uncharacterized protein n=1 Tax=Fomitopsis serialis TaxID=139415 RepID=UPI00200791AA|nr:uncharacterized protein B0H18DRAFT_570989 [Neoantrodia serialis]KAH9921139.1 hypothetical protein B0H18DRAFT_570989 [Neoantrodia serialis]